LLGDASMSCSAWAGGRERGRGDLLEASAVGVSGAEDPLLAAIVLLVVVAAAIPTALAIRCHRSAVRSPGTRSQGAAASLGADASSQEDRRDSRVARMLAEASAQYHVWPTDYLEGVVAALHETVYDAPFVAGARDQEQAGNAAGRTASGRLRDYYVGRIAALGWILGERAEPPVQTILTDDGVPPGPSQGDNDCP
jgi:hypothetical protein